MLSEDLNLSENEELNQDSESVETPKPEATAPEPFIEITPEVVEHTPVEVVSVNVETTPEMAVEEATPPIENTNQDATVLETAQFEVINVEEEELESAPMNEAELQNFNKKDFVELLEKLLVSVKSENASMSDMKNVDVVLREVRPMFETLKRTEKLEAKKAFIEANGSEEGFVYENDNFNVRYDSVSSQIREIKTNYFSKLEQNREDNFATKTKLLQDLRELVANEEIAPSKTSWANFKKIQEAWKGSGSVAAVHNQSLWAAYNALVDRYFSNRNIFNELMDLDRKKNQQAKEILCDKVEVLASKLDGDSLTNSLIKEANDLFEEYKHIGPAPKESNEKLWNRFKLALDKLYEKRREQQSGDDTIRGEVLNVKIEMVKVAEAIGSFKGANIPEWNTKTKELQELQDQWNGIKGGMPREKGKEVSKQFWAALKNFFNNKSEFFKTLENERGANLTLKNGMIEEVENMVKNEDFSAIATNRVIELQKEWKSVGFVPEKFKNSIYEKFKNACDGFFNGKRNSSSSVDQEFEVNLAKKIGICEALEAAAAETPDLNKLPEIKAEFSSIGFVPRKNMQDIQKRFVDAVNLFVKNSSISAAEKERMMMKTEKPAQGASGGNRERTNFNNTASSGRNENMDLKKKIQKIEDEIALYRNNIEFFARSKNAAALRAEIDIKIAKAEKELEKLKNS